MSRRKYFKYLEQISTEAVEKFGRSIVDKLWKNRRSIDCIVLPKRAMLSLLNNYLWKSEFSTSKKNF